MFVGMLSKSLGQILRVSAYMHVLFHMESDDPLPAIISESAIEAAIDFVEVCCQHTAYLTGWGDINLEVDLMEAGKLSMFKNISVHYSYNRVCSKGCATPIK